MLTGTLLPSHESPRREYRSSYAPSMPQIKHRVSIPIPVDHHVTHCGLSHLHR